MRRHRADDGYTLYYNSDMLGASLSLCMTMTESLMQLLHINSASALRLLLHLPPISLSCREVWCMDGGLFTYIPMNIQRMFLFSRMARKKVQYKRRKAYKFCRMSYVVSS